MFANLLLLYRSGPAPVPVSFGAPYLPLFIAIRRRRLTAVVVPASLATGFDRHSLAIGGIRGLLVNAGLFTAPACVISLDPNYKPTAAPPACAIEPRPLVPSESYQLGGGRYETVADATFILRIITRRLRDIDGQHGILLTHPTAGTLPMAFLVVNALAEQFPLDTTGAAITIIGLKYAGTGSTYTHPKDDGLAVTPVTFRTRILVGLRVPDPGS